MNNNMQWKGKASKLCVNLVLLPILLRSTATPPIFLSIVLQLMNSPTVPHCLCLAVSHRHSPLKPFIHYKKSSQHCCVVLSISLGSHEPELLKGVFDIMIIFYLFTFTLVWISWWVCKLVAFTCGLGFFFYKEKTQSNLQVNQNVPKHTIRQHFVH